MTEKQVQAFDVVRGINDQIVDLKPVHVAPDPILENYDPFAKLTEREGGRYRMSLMEALLSKPDAAVLLRDGFRFISFQTMRGIPRTWDLIARTENSSKKEEEYLLDAAMGVIPIKPSGEPVDFVQSNILGATKITNHLRRMGVQITGDDILFDRTGKVRQIAFELGRSAVATEEASFYANVTTTGNYVRNSTTNDNDVGVNYADATFNALDVECALATIATSKDRKSGQYLGYKADTIIVTPLMEHYVKSFFLSPEFSRQATAAAAEIRGGGTSNPYLNGLSRIIVSPWLGTSYHWVMVDSTAYSYVWQWVKPWDIMQEGQSEMSEAWLINNALRYVIMGYFGHGFVDDRAWYYSYSATAPTVS
jgi:hypothetical protein